MAKEAEYWDPAVIRGEFDDLLAVESGLTDWELGFIEDISDTIEVGDNLTAAQRDKLHEIWREKV